MRGKPFEAGNTFGKGRPRGSRNKRTVLMELLEDHGVGLIKQCISMAYKSDSTAIRLCVERLIPPCRAPNNKFRLPPMNTLEDLLKVLPVVAKAVAHGRLSAQEGDAFFRMIESHRRNIEAVEFEKRLGALEKGREEGRISP